MSIEKLHEDLSIRAKKGVPMFYAGIFFWLAAGISGFLFPQNILIWIYVYGIGLILPLGFAIAKLLKIDFLAKDNPLSTVGGLVGGVQIFFIPVVILVMMNEPQWIPFIIGILAGAHFFPYVWIYKSNAYLFQTVAQVAASTVIGYIYMAEAYKILPFVLIVVYSITAVRLNREVENLSRTGMQNRSGVSTNQ